MERGDDWDSRAGRGEEIPPCEAHGLAKDLRRQLKGERVRVNGGCRICTGANVATCSSNTVPLTWRVDSASPPSFSLKANLSLFRSIADFLFSTSSPKTCAADCQANEFKLRGACVATCSETTATSWCVRLICCPRCSLRNTLQHQSFRPRDRSLSLLCHINLQIRRVRQGSRLLCLRSQLRHLQRGRSNLLVRSALNIPQSQSPR